MGRPGRDVEAAGVGKFQTPLMYLAGGGFFTATAHLATAAALTSGLAASFPAMAEGCAYGRTVRAGAQAAIMAGSAIGGLAQGPAADRIGRLPLFRWSMVAAAIGAVLVAAAPHIALFLLARLFLGVAIGIALVVDFVLLAEFLPASSRGGNIALVIAAGIAAFFYAALSVFLVNIAVPEPSSAWRVLVLVLGMPAAACAAGRFLCWTDESPFFLHARGRDIEYSAVIARMCAANNVPVPSQSPPSTPNIVTNTTSHPDVFPRRLVAAVAALYVLQTIGYYGLVVWLAEIGSSVASAKPSVALTYVLVGAAEAAGLAVAAVLIDRGGRRSVLLLGFGVSAACTAAMLAVPRGHPLVFYALYAATFFGVILVWTGLYVAAPEIFATGVRARATGVANAAGKVAGILSPIILSLLAASRGLIGLIGAAFATAAAIVLLVIPETSRESLL